VEDLVGKVSEAFAGIDDERLRYLLIWRFATDMLRQLEQGAEKHERRFRLGVLWDLLPADTRIPDHPLVFHDSLVAALAPIVHAGEDAALLRFAVGPVQPFVQNARKLRDLWAASSILAETAWQAMLPIVREHGPDSILFPNLGAEPRFDRWLIGEIESLVLSEPLKAVVNSTRDHLDRSLRIPSLPNVFTAVLPLSRAEELARQAEEAVRQYWQGEAAAKAAEAGAGEPFIERAREQARALIEVSWGIAPWPLVQEITRNNLDSYPRWHRSELHAEAAAKNAAKLSSVLGGYKPNGGLLYPDSFEQSGLLVDAAKRERLQLTRDEQGLKCSVCGEHEVLGPGDFWTQRAAVRQDRAKLNPGEQLCGPCTWKRHFDLNIDARFGERHPSTGEIAAARFKLDLIRKWRDSEALYRAMKRFVEAAEDAARVEAIHPTDVSVWSVQAVDMAVRESGEPLVEELARIDGQWLLPFPREEAPGGTETTEARMARKKLDEAASQLRREAGRAKIEAPRPYLAVVVFDGDRMGQWVSGTHDRFPRLWSVLHIKVKRQIENAAAPFDQDARRFLAPAFHAALSGIAATFARYTVPMTIEGEGLCGHLVYTGGDDALFLAPVSEALDLANRLRLRFSGWPGSFDGNGTEPDFRPWTTVRLGDRGLPMPAAMERDVDRLGLAFGAAATASAGMCVFHYRWPLGAALEMARQVEGEAKRSGRKALGILVQRRSGSMTKTVIPFASVRTREGEERLWDLDGAPMTHFRDLVRLLADGHASPRLASIFRAEVEALHPEVEGSDKLWEMANALAKRAVKRREVEAPEDVRKRLETCVLALGEAMRNRASDTSLAIHDWCEALTAAAFLARPGD
jgi:CRISPR-associated protein Cmr2